MTLHLSHNNRPLNNGADTSAFDRLHRDVQRWIWDNKWDELRDIQSQAIHAILSHNNDVILAADTASGKTEAAFLPVLTQIADRTRPGFSVLYIAPLKALINDQFRRLEKLCERMHIPVTKWHGDASQAARHKAINNPKGIVLITPESIEALLIRRSSEVKRLFGDLECFIIDELHAFLGQDRGTHLASLINRLQMYNRHRVRTIGLSATIGDFQAARRFLHPAQPDNVDVLKDGRHTSDVRLHIYAVREPPPRLGHKDEKLDAHEIALRKISDQLFANLRGANHLVFASSRRHVELISDTLRETCESEGVPNEFFAHHGSLSKLVRETLEQRLQDGRLPTTAVATTTLEMGIDIGSVKSVAQIGPPASLASMRQRLGRSGRRSGEASMYRIYVSERDGPPTGDDNGHYPSLPPLTPFDRLRPDVVQAIAAVRLLIEKWIEPTKIRTGDLSTLLHQIIAIIIERGGITESDLYNILTRAAPFEWVTPAILVRLLRAAANHKPNAVLERSRNGTWMLGPLGEKLEGGHDIYTVFHTDLEYRIMTQSRTLGTVPIRQALVVGHYLIFAGRRWLIEHVDSKGRVVRVKPADTGRVPKFTPGEGPPVHDRLLAEMRAVYRDADRPAFVDAMALELLIEGRRAYDQFNLDNDQIIYDGGAAYLLLWRGTHVRNCIALALSAADIHSHPHTLGLFCPRTPGDHLRRVLAQLADAPPSAQDLAQQVQNLHRRKYDRLIDDELLRQALADEWIAHSEVTATARQLLNNMPPHVGSQ